jgi:prevent-host-death family protein
MKSASIRELKHELTKVLNWVQEGEEVEIRKRNQIVARLVPPRFRRPRQRKKARPDFAARLKRIYGDKVFSDNIVIEEREASRW